MIKHIVGDLVESAKNGEFDVIAHQCNCFNTMGSGIALTIKNEWPEAFDVDNATVKGDQNKLGTISFTQGTNPIIVNLYGQFNYWDKGILTQYDALEKALIALKSEFPNKKIGMPKKMGADRARGDWATILQIIEKVFSDPTDDVTIVEWNQNVQQQGKQIAAGNQNVVSGLSAFSNLGKSQSSSTSPSTLPTNMTTSTPTSKKKFRGKRKCKVCHTMHSIKDMHNYLPGVWVCKQNCNQSFVDNVVKINELQIVTVQQSAPAPLSTVTD